MDTLFNENTLIKSNSTSSEKVTINSFSLLSVIGKGSYAEVILARKKDTGKIYALKILKKKKIEQKNQKGHVSTERNILVTLSLTPSNSNLDRHESPFHCQTRLRLPKRKETLLRP